MSASNTLETALLELLFNATAFANIADNAATAPLTDLYVSLHSSDPGEAGDQSTNEITYTGYARVAVSRDGTGFTVSGNSVVNASEVTFPECSSGSAVATHFGIGTDSSGAGRLLVSGALDSSLSISTNIAPRFQSGQLDVDVD